MGKLEYCFVATANIDGARALAEKENTNIMAKEKRVEQITDMEKDFAQWFTDVCTKAELVDYSGVKGCFILRPYGYAIWENISRCWTGCLSGTGTRTCPCPC